MRNLIVACLGLCLLSAAPAQAKRLDPVLAAKTLLAKLKAHEPRKAHKPIKALDTPLLSFLPSPSAPKQGQNLTVIMESLNAFPGRILSIDFSVNGGATQSAPLIDSSTMFAAYLGTQSLVATNFIDATLYAESSANNADIRTAIKNLDTNINHLTSQINADRDPADRAKLQEQRSEQLALKNELVYELKAYRTLIGTQRFTYSVAPDSSNPSLPSISGVSPAVGEVRGGTVVNISGQNFSQGVTAKFSGIPSPSVTLVNATTVQAVTPDFGAGGTGAKDVELDFPSGAGSNAILAGAFFAQAGAQTSPQKPIAIASGSGAYRNGSTVLLDGSQSYARSGSLIYSWTITTAPAASQFQIGNVVGSTPSISFVPDAIGTFVVQLVVTEASTLERLASDPSLIVLQVGNGPQPVANAIVVSQGSSGTTQILPNDSSGQDVTYAITRVPTVGTATVSTTGLVTYTPPGTFSGSDGMVVTVTDQSGISAPVSIPITVISGAHQPVVSANPIVTNTEPGVSQISVSGIDSSHALTYSIFFAPEHGTASIDTNGLFHYASAAGYTGHDAALVRVTDTVTQLTSEGAISITVNPNSQPVVTAPGISVAQGTSGTSQASVSDDPGQSGTYSVSAPANGTASVSAGGLVTYVPNSGFVGSDSLILSYVDNGNPALTGTVSISVSVYSHNNSPVASAPPITVKPGASGTSQVNGYDRDAYQTVSYAITAPPANGTATLSSTGLVTYTPNSGYTGNDSLIVTVSDNGSPQLSVNVTIPIVVSNLNPPSLPDTLRYLELFGNAPYQIGMGFSAAINQFITDGNGGITKEVWDFGDGTHELNFDRLNAATSHNYVEAGTYRAVLTVTDAAGLTASASQLVTIADMDVPVVRVTMSPSTGGATPLSVTFDASASTSTDGIKEYHWQFCGVNPEAVTTTPTITHTFTAGCSVRVRAFSATTTAVGQSTIVVPTAATAGAAPVSQFTITPLREVLPGVSLAFDGLRSIDPNVGGSLTNYNWNFNDNACSPTCTANGQTASHTYNSYGGWYPSLTVTNSLGFVNPSSVQVLVVHPGTHGPRSIVTASALRGVAPFTVSFDGSQSYGYYGATIQSITHFYGDGTTPGAGPATSHTYTHSGVYTMTNLVTDNNGNSASAFQTITVTNTRAELQSVRDGVSSDPDREYQRQMLSGACNAGDGAACYGLSQMFAEDGDAYTAGELKARACTFGYAPACN